MHSTKRKFNTLLNNIGSKSPTSPSLSSQKDVNNASSADLTTTTTSSGIDAQVKKRRTSISIPGEAPRPVPARTLATKLSAAAAIPHKKSASVATATLNTEPLKYAPWDRAEFLKRLKSFSSLTDWTPKPPRVNEVEWAKRGWVCQKMERVRCCLCNLEILVKLNQKVVDGKEEPVYVGDNIENALVDKYVELIVDSHDENCLWRQRGCDDSIFKLPLTHAPTTLETLRERYDELIIRKENLPYSFNIRTPPELDLDTVLDCLPKNFFADPTSDNSLKPEVNKVAFTFALFGWQSHTHERLGNQLGSVSCHACFRVLGLWLFKSKGVNSAGEETIGPIVNFLDVVQEHRDYCPWRNAQSQNGQNSTAKGGSTSKSGWEVIIRVLKNDYYLRIGKSATPKKATTPQPSTPIADNASEIDSVLDDTEDAKSRDEKDKERWARLRRVKSLFDTKGKRKSVIEKVK